MKGNILALLYTVGSFGVILAQDCDFDGNVCGWINSNWTLTNYLSASDVSGPRSFFDGGYIYLDTIASNLSVATLRTSPFSINGNLCFLFRYHMKSVVNTMGTLLIAVNGNNVYNITGHQGNEWHCGRIYLSPFGSQITLQLTGYRLEQQPYSVIALDAFHFLPLNGSKCQDNLLLSLQDCDAMTVDFSTDKTSLFTDSTKVITSSEVTSLVPTPAISDFLIYVIAVPSGVLVLSVIFIVICVCCRKKQTDNMYFGPLNHLQQNQPQGRKPSESPSQRYPSIQIGHAEEVYDEIKDDQYDYIRERGQYARADEVESPTSTQSTDYTILPAITKPQAPYDDDYLQPKRIMSAPHGKISISEQGATYTDVSNTSNIAGHEFENTGTPDYLECI